MKKPSIYSIMLIFLALILGAIVLFMGRDSQYPEWCKHSDASRTEKCIKLRNEQLNPKY